MSKTNWGCIAVANTGLSLTANGKEIVGKRCGHLVIIGPPFLIRRFSGGKRRHEPYCVCECDCGNAVAIPVHRIKAANVCTGNCRLRNPKPKGPTSSPLYNTWNGMIHRCENPKQKAYHRYGGRGIRVCKEWRDSFYVFEEWALTHGWSPDLEIDRRDNDGNYDPNNCRFVTQKINSRNTRRTHFETAFGETKSLADWSEDSRALVSSRDMLSQRLERGWEFVRALTTPPQR